MSDKGEWTIEDWVKNLREQAEYFKRYRHMLYNRVDLESKTSVLDIGCGTGDITRDIASITDGYVTGIDVDREKLIHAQSLLSTMQQVTLAEASAVNLPFEDNAFDLVVFCLVLMYVKDKQKAVEEMVRVTREKGIVLATMEPDYRGTINYPETKSHPLFLDTMKDFGADLEMGRKLRYLFSKAGLQTEVGIHTFNLDFMNQEGMEMDLFLKQFWLIEKTLMRNDWTREQIEAFKKEQIELIKKKMSFTLMPVFYAIGKKI